MKLPVQLCDPCRMFAFKIFAEPEMLGEIIDHRRRKYDSRDRYGEDKKRIGRKNNGARQNERCAWHERKSPEKTNYQVSHHYVVFELREKPGKAFRREEFAMGKKKNDTKDQEEYP